MMVHKLNAPSSLLFNEMFLKVSVLFISIGFLSKFTFSQDFQLPIHTRDRFEISFIKLTDIGTFGEKRKMRTGIQAHLHTGIDIKRPTPNYTNEPVFSIGIGRVISIRNDGPYAQIIIEHSSHQKMFWTVYEHIAGIKVRVGDLVNGKKPIARFMNKSELNKYGWQFDHFHFEILKIPPIKIKPNKSQPQHFFNTHNLLCYTLKDLENKYFNPIVFLENQEINLNNSILFKQ